MTREPQNLKMCVNNIKTLIHLYGLFYHSRYCYMFSDDESSYEFQYSFVPTTEEPLTPEEIAEIKRVERASVSSVTKFVNPISQFCNCY